MTKEMGIRLVLTKEVVRDYLDFLKTEKEHISIILSDGFASGDEAAEKHLVESFPGYEKKERDVRKTWQDVGRLTAHALQSAVVKGELQGDINVDIKLTEMHSAET